MIISTSIPSTTLSVLAFPLGQNHLNSFLLLLLCNKFKSIWVGSSSSNSIGNCWAPKLSDIFVACCQQQRRQQQLELEKIYCQQICLNAAIFPFLLSFYNGCYSALSMLTFFHFFTSYILSGTILAKCRKFSFDCSVVVVAVIIITTTTNAGK